MLLKTFGNAPSIEQETFVLTAAQKHGIVRLFLSTSNSANHQDID